MEININDLIKEKIDDMDLADMVDTVIRQLITEDIKKAINEKVKEIANDVIKTATLELIRTVPLKLNDGWDSKEYPSFEEFVKQFFKNRVKDSWDLKRMFECVVQEEASKIFGDREAVLKTAFKDFIDNFKLKK